MFLDRVCVSRLGGQLARVLIVPQTCSKIKREHWYQAAQMPD